VLRALSTGAVRQYFHGLGLDSGLSTIPAGLAPYGSGLLVTLSVTV
jgi:hypothetical protein